MVALAGLAACGGGSVQPSFAPTFTNVNGKIFQISCTLSGCHTTGAGPSVGNLDLSDSPYLALVGDGGVPAIDIGAPYDYQYGGMLLVKPGDPAGSLLYQKLNAALAAASGCAQTATGPCEYGEHMPNVGGEALDPGDIEAVREWIADGAQND